LIDFFRQNPKQASQKIKQAENQQASFVKLVEELADMREKNKSLTAEVAKQKVEIKKLSEERDTLKSVVDDYDVVLGSDLKKKK
jgi:uncharacterized coiled-coil DUF342 family protein